MKNILIICKGNINRSAVAGNILRKNKGHVYNIQSAAIGDWHVGKQYSKQARLWLDSNGYDKEGVPQQVDQELIDWADAIIFMDENIRKHVLIHFNIDRILLNCFEVEDPHKQTDKEYFACFEQVELLLKTFNPPLG